MLARKLKISIPAVSKSVIRGEKLVQARQYALIEQAKVNKSTTSPYSLQIKLLLTLIKIGL